MTAGKELSGERSRKSVEPTLSQQARAPAASGRTLQAGLNANSLAHMSGNFATQRLLTSGSIRAKMLVSQPGDPHEQQAEDVAQKVVTMSPASSTLNGVSNVRQGTSEHGTEIRNDQMATAIMPLAQDSPTNSAQHAAQESGFSSGFGSTGLPLSTQTRAFMESRFGADFSGIRLHTDSNAARLNREINAQAFTHGRDIYLGDKAPDLGSTAGKQLLAHELTHTIQQGSGVSRQDSVPKPEKATVPSIQRQALPATPPVPAPIPAPAAGVSPPSPSVPPVGASKAETDAVELPLVAQTLPITFSSTRRDLKLTTEDLSEFEILKGEISTPAIPLLDTGVSAKFSAKAEEGIRLANASLFITPILGEITGQQIAAAQKTKEKSGIVGAAAGGIVGGLLGLTPLGLIPGLGPLKGAEIGGVKGGAAAEELSELFTDTEFTVRLTQGAGGLNLALTYNPQLTMELSATGFSWLSTLETTLLTNLALTADALLDFRESYVKLKFSHGRLIPSEFEIKPKVRPVLKAAFDASGQLIARLIIMPFLRNEKPKVGEEEAIEAAEVVTVPFHLFSWDGTFEGDPILTAVKGSPLEVRRKRVKADEGKVPAAFKSALSSSNLKPDTTKAQKAKEPEGLSGTHTGLTPKDAIPLIWWKPFSSYVAELHLPASEFGTDRKARRFPNKHYHNERRGTDLSLGVDNWPYKGMPLRKKQNERNKQKVEQFKEALALHGVDLDRQAPGAQIDHVIDLPFHVGFDREENFWPLDAGVNMRAGGKYSNGTYLVTWAEKPGDAPRNTTPADVPVGRWFVIVDNTQLP